MNSLTEQNLIGLNLFHSPLRNELTLGNSLVPKACDHPLLLQTGSLSSLNLHLLLEVVPHVNLNLHSEFQAVRVLV